MTKFRETCLDILHRCGDAIRDRNEQERREREKKERHRERCRKYRQRKKEEDCEAFLQKQREEAQACRDRAKAADAEAVQQETKASRKREAQFHAEMTKIARSPIAVPDDVKPRQREPWEIAADIDRLFREQTQPAEPHTFTEAEEQERREELERSMHKGNGTQPSTDGKKKPRTPEEEEKLEASRRYNRRHRAYKKYIKELDDIDSQTKLTPEERRQFKAMALRRYQAKMGCDVGEVPEAPKLPKANEQYAGLTPAEVRRKQDATLRRLQEAQQRREENERDERERREMETMQQRLADAYRASVTPQAVIDRRPVCYDPHCMRCSRRLNSQGQHVCSLSECVLPTMNERKARYAADLERAARPIEGAECYDPTAAGAFNCEDYNHYAHESRHAYYARPFSLEAMEAETYRLDTFNEALYPNARN